MGSVKTPPGMIKPEEMTMHCGMSADNIRQAMRKGIFPVGFAFKTESGTWRYYTPRAEFEKWMSGELPSCTGYTVAEVTNRIIKQIQEMRRAIG